MHVLHIDGLKVTFRVPHGAVKAVDGATLTVSRGETTALVGESGSGKSVIARAVMGLLPRNACIDGGAIRFCDPGSPDSTTDLARLPSSAPAWQHIRGARIGMIFQEPMSALSPLHTIGDQIGEAFRLHSGASRREANAETRDMLRRVGFPDTGDALNRYPFELSGGLRQRAVIAMALICRPALLIADEPTTALDVTLQAQVLKLLQDLQAELDMALLFITHDLGVVANVADSMAVLFRGRIMERGPAAELLSTPQHPYLQGLLGAVPRIHAGPRKGLVSPRKPGSENIDSPNQTLFTHPRSEEPGQCVLKVRGLVKHFSTRHARDADEPAVNGVSFDLYSGECLGLVGESGSGKTTTAKLLVGAFPPDLGSISVRQGDVWQEVPAMGSEALKACRRRIQYVFQDPFASLNPRMTVFDILREPLVVHRMCSKAEQRRRILEVVALTGLDPSHLNRYPHAFSGGQRQRIGIARALVLQPDILLLDEPVSALDVSVQARILDLLRELKERLNLTCIFVSHNLAVIDYMADRIAVMCRGRIVELAPRERLFGTPRHPYTRTLLSAVPRVAPHSRLNLTALMDGRMSDPSAWQEPFALRTGEPAALVPAAPDHCIGVAWRHRHAALPECA